MDAKNGACFGLALLILLPAVASANPYQVAYVEKRDGVRRELVARIDGEEIFIDRLRGAFPPGFAAEPPWYLKGFSLLDENLQLKGSGLPLLDFQKEIHDGIVTLSLTARSEILPRNPEETALNEMLRQGGIEEIALKGEGRVWTEETTGEVIAETLFLSGEVVRNGRKEHWQVEWAWGRQ